MTKDRVESLIGPGAMAPVPEHTTENQMRQLLGARSGDARVDWTRVQWFFVVPMGLSGLMLGMYFSGVRWMQTVVCAPYFESVPMNSRREFGLLETLQHLMLLAVVVIAVRSAISKPHWLLKVFMGLVALGTAFLLLEELDYGLHYYEYLAGVKHDETAVFRNLHNVGGRTAQLKSIGTVLAVVVFGIAPFALSGSKNRWVRYFTPSPYMALLLVVAVMTRTIAHTLDARGLGYGLAGNLSEFRELVLYYTGLAYTIVLARRTLDAPANAPDRA